MLQVIRLSQEARDVAVQPYHRCAPTARVLKRLQDRQLVGKRLQRVHCMHLHTLPAKLQNLDPDLLLKSTILGAVTLLTRTEDKVHW